MNVAVCKAFMSAPAMTVGFEPTRQSREPPPGLKVQALLTYTGCVAAECPRSTAHPGTTIHV